MNENETETCPVCGEPYPCDGRWPVGDTDQACQTCWEADCDRAWWEMVRHLPED